MSTFEVRYFMNVLQDLSDHQHKVMAKLDRVERTVARLEEENREAQRKQALDMLSDVDIVERGIDSYQPGYRASSKAHHMVVKRCST